MTGGFLAEEGDACKAAAVRRTRMALEFALQSVVLPESEYYRLAKKIGRLMGWSNKKNKYIKETLSYTIDRLNQINSGGCCYGDVYSGTKHKYASSINMYVYEECGFYDYEGIYFAINAIFAYYEKQLKRLKRIYAGIMAISISLLLPQELEVAA